MGAMYWLQRPARTKPASRPAPIPAGLAVIPYDPVRGQAGEMIVAAPSKPQPAPPQPFVIPPWPEEERRREAAVIAAAEPPAEPISIGDDWDPPAPELGPPLKLEPLQRFVPPPPDWRAEEAKAKNLERKERVKRERYERLLKLLDEEGT